MTIPLSSDASGEPPARTVPCPSCAQPALFHRNNPWRPFCSQRCRHVDLGAWASESYRVAAVAPVDDDSALEPDSPRF